MIHLYGGWAAKDDAGVVATGGAAIDHVALVARDFDAMKAEIVGRDLDWRQNDLPGAGLWQLFVHDPNGVLIELNFTIADEPDGAAGPDGTNVYAPGF